MLKKTLVVATMFFIVMVGVLASVDVYYRSDGGGVECALWNADEAYLFANVIHRGYRFSYLGSLVEMVKEYFYVVPAPTDEASSTVVFRITPSGVQAMRPGTCPLTSTLRLRARFTRTRTEHCGSGQGLILRWPARKNSGDSTASSGFLQKISVTFTDGQRDADQGT
jgi:hypothetical protein